MDNMDIILGGLLRKHTINYLTIKVDGNGESGVVYYYESGSDSPYNFVRFSS